MPASIFDSKDFEVISKEYSSLEESARKRCANEKELDVVRKAFEFANEAHKNVRRRSGAPYILHPIAVAKIVVDEIGLGYKSIASALLHDVVEDTEYTVEDIRSLFGDKIALIVDGLTKIKHVFDNQNEEDGIKDIYVNSSQAENFKRILLTLNDDVRVVLIKLADRLHNCRTIEFMPEYKRDKILSETMFIFIPLAHRLGLYAIKSELENIWLKFKEPGAYRDLTARIEKNIGEKGVHVDHFIDTLHKILDGKIDFHITKRVKTPYSIWRKMQVKKVSFEQIYDLFAIRIIFNPRKELSEGDQCFQIYNLLCKEFQSRSDRLRNWVSTPKSNGYEALHCTLIDKSSGLTVEVQIRSKRMDDIAEKGIAAHWAYKKEGYLSEQDSNMDAWLAKIQDILSSPDINALELLDIVHNDLTIGEIVVFTPKGAQKRVPKNSTVLDFAYQVHTDIGNRAIAAKVNMKLVPLSEQLKSGDIIEVITAEDATPKKENLSFLKTRTAKNKMIDWFRKDFNLIRDEGREACIRDFSLISVQLTAQQLGRIAARTGFNKADEFLFHYGLGLINFSKIAEMPMLMSSIDATNLRDTKKIDRDNFVIGAEEDNHLYKIANCCNPIAGDPIIGFLSPDGTVTIHKKSCPVAESVASKHGDWIVMPQWRNTRHQSFLVRIKMSGIDRMGLLNEITRYISLIMGVNIKGLSIGASDGIMDGRIDLYVHDRDVLEELISRLREINGITSVERSEIVKKA